jgi:hypothetical protein
MVPSWTEAGARLLVLKHFDQYINIGNVRWGLYELMYYTIYGNGSHFISFVHSIVEEGGTTFSFGRACERCHVKTVIQVHNPQLYWKVLLSSSVLSEDFFSPFL